MLLKARSNEQSIGAHCEYIFFLLPFWILYFVHKNASVYIGHHHSDPQISDMYQVLYNRCHFYLDLYYVSLSTHILPCVWGKCIVLRTAACCLGGALANWQLRSHAASSLGADVHSALSLSLHSLSGAFLVLVNRLVIIVISILPLSPPQWQSLQSYLLVKTTFRNMKSCLVNTGSS